MWSDRGLEGPDELWEAPPAALSRVACRLPLAPSMDRLPRTGRSTSRSAIGLFACSHTRSSMLEKQRDDCHLLPQSHDDRYYQQLYQPVTGVNRGHLHRDILPEDGSSQKDYRKSDPKKQANVCSDEPIVNAERRDEMCDDVGEDEAPHQLYDQLPCGHLCAGHRHRRVHAACAHPRLVEKQGAVPEPAEHEHYDCGYEDRDVVHVRHRSISIL